MFQPLPRGGANIGLFFAHRKSDIKKGRGHGKLIPCPLSFYAYMRPLAEFVARQVAPQQSLLPYSSAVQI